MTPGAYVAQELGLGNISEQHEQELTRLYRHTLFKGIIERAKQVLPPEKRAELEKIVDANVNDSLGPFMDANCPGWNTTWLQEQGPKVFKEMKESFERMKTGENSPSSSAYKLLWEIVSG